jgi:hypothetical protein
VSSEHLIRVQEMSRSDLFGGNHDWPCSTLLPLDFGHDVMGIRVMPSTAELSYLKNIVGPRILTAITASETALTISPTVHIKMMAVPKIAKGVI